MQILSRPTDDTLSSRWQTAIRWTLIVCMLAGIYIRWAWGTDFTYVSFTDRDLGRGLDLWTDFQHMGPELGERIARTPGGGLAYFNNFLQAINPDANFIHSVVTLMDCAVLVALPFLFAPLIGWTAALFAAALYGITPAVLENIWKFWNPSYSLLFGMLFYYFLLTYRGPNDKVRLALAFACIGIAGQFHGSFYYLVPVTVLFLATMRRRVSFSAAALAAAVFVFVLLPFIVIDGASGFEAVGSILTSYHTGEYQQTGDEPTWWQLVLDFSDKMMTGLSPLTGGRLFSSGQMPAIIEGNALFFATSMLAFNIGFVLVVAYLPVAAYRMLKRPSENVSGDLADTIKGLLILFVIAILFTSTYGNTIASRYVLFVVWPGILLAAIGFQELIRIASRYWPHRLVGVLAMGIAMILLVRAGAVAHYYWVSPRETRSSFQVKDTLVRALKKKFGYTDRDMDTRVSLIIRKKGKLKFWDHWENLSWTYISRTTTVSPSAPRYAGCALVVANQRRVAPPPEIDAETIKSLLPFSRGFKIERSFMPAPDLRVIGYRVDGSNCPITFTNAYLLTPLEKSIEAETAGMPSGVMKSLKSPDGTRRFITRLEAGVYIPVLIELTQVAGGIKASIKGNALRGYAPAFSIPRATLDAPRLRFTPLSGKGSAITLNGPAKLGTKGVFAPWDFGRAALAPGAYDVDFVVDGIWTYFGTAGAVTVRIADGFSVPAL